MRIGNRNFEDNERPYIMGILNVTPDSFSDGGQHNKLDDALAETEKMINEGADIIDVGGESTRPGYTLISDEEEMERVCPVIEGIKARFDIPVSLDTYKSGVAEAGIKSGCDMINDIWGLKWDGTMAQVIAKYNVACCLMHNRKDTNYVNFLQDVITDLDETMNMAAEAGINKSQIMVDPGIGFAKSCEQNLKMMNNLEMLRKWEVPVLLGTSRKSMIGLTLDLPVTEREEGTIATSVLGLVKGCSYFRVHNVKANYRALKMTSAMLKA
ncbi:MAG: dihydropteroate synthase [Coprococcus sp.]